MKTRLLMILLFLIIGSTGVIVSFAEIEQVIGEYEFVTDDVVLIDNELFFISSPFQLVEEPHKITKFHRVNFTIPYLPKPTPPGGIRSTSIVFPDGSVERISIGVNPDIATNFAQGFGLKVGLSRHPNDTFFFLVSINAEPPLKQFKSRISIEEIKCRESLILVQKYNGLPACVKQDTKEALIQRDWIYDITQTSQRIPEGLIDKDCPISFIDKSKYKIPKPDSNIIVEPESPITEWGQLYLSYEKAQDFMNMHDIFLPSYMPQCLKLDSIRATTGSLGEKFLTIVYLLEGIEPSGYYTLTNATEQGLTIQIINDNDYVYQYNDDYVRTQAEENKNLGWDHTRIGNFAVLLKSRNAEYNMPSEVDTIIKHQSIKIRSKILEIDELEKIFRSMFG